MAKIIMRKEYGFFLLASVVLAAVFAFIDQTKENTIAQLRRDLQKSQMIIIIQHNIDEILQARMTALEDSLKKGKS